MPSSNPLPPKENALFKRILVSSGRSKYSVLDPTLSGEQGALARALMMKHSSRGGEKLGKGHWQSRDAAACLASRTKSRHARRPPAMIGIVDPPQMLDRTHRTPPLLPNPNMAFSRSMHLGCLPYRDATNTNNTKMGSSSRNRSCQIPSSASMGRPWR